MLQPASRELECICKTGWEFALEMALRRRRNEDKGEIKALQGFLAILKVQIAIKRWISLANWLISRNPIGDGDASNTEAKEDWQIVFNNSVYCIFHDGTFFIANICHRT